MAFANAPPPLPPRDAPLRWRREPGAPLQVGVGLKTGSDSGAALRWIDAPGRAPHRTLPVNSCGTFSPTRRGQPGSPRRSLLSDDRCALRRRFRQGNLRGQQRDLSLSHSGARSSGRYLTISWCCRPATGRPPAWYPGIDSLYKGHSPRRSSQPAACKVDAVCATQTARAYDNHHAAVWRDNLHQLDGRQQLHLHPAEQRQLAKRQYSTAHCIRDSDLLLTLNHLGSTTPPSAAATPRDHPARASPRADRLEANIATATRSRTPHYLLELRRTSADPACSRRHADRQRLLSAMTSTARRRQKSTRRRRLGPVGVYRLSIPPDPRQAGPSAVVGSSSARHH